MLLTAVENGGAGRSNLVALGWERVSGRDYVSRFGSDSLAAGTLKTLEEVVVWYVKGRHPNSHLRKDIRKARSFRAG
jgi:hypothetical protein